MKKNLHVLTGATAVGKTEWALRWAEARGAEIVSCDSLLFYRGMDIGTAKPTCDEQRRVPHHLIDVCAVTERMDITVYIAKARAAVEDVVARGREVLVTGGSGFYLKSFLAPVADDVAVSPELRAAVGALSAAEAVAKLGELNPDGVGALDIENPRRVTRALERCLASGKTLAVLAQEFSRRPGTFADWQVRLSRLDREPADLDRRVVMRVEAMMHAGLVDEVRGLRGLGLEQNPSAAGAIGYREVLAFLDGKLREPELVGEIAKNTRGLVKKQRTWFRTQLPPHRVLPAASVRDVRDLFGDE